MPGVTITNPGPACRLMRAISRGEATTPSISARLASRARRTTWSSTSPSTPPSRRPRRARLVSTVTARMRGRRRPSRRQTRATSSRVRVIICRLPDACTSKKRTPSRAASTPALATVVGMSWNLRSRKTSRAWRWTMRTTSGPACRKSCLPTLKVPTSGASSRTRPSASDRRSTSSAKIRRCRRLSLERRITSMSPASHLRGHPGPNPAPPHPPRPARGARLHLDAAARERARAHGDPHGKSDQIRVLELDAWALLAVVEQRIHAGALECVREGLGRLPQGDVAHAHRHDVRAVRRERRRPDDAGIVVVLLDGRGDGPRDADAVAPHLDRPFLAVGAEEGGPHRLRVLRAEEEHLPNLDAAMGGERPGVAARAGITAVRLPEIRELYAREVAGLVEVDDVLVGAIRARHRAADAAQRGIGED